MYSSKEKSFSVVFELTRPSYIFVNNSRMISTDNQTLRIRTTCKGITLKPQDLSKRTIRYTLELELIFSQDFLHLALNFFSLMYIR